MRAPCEQGFHSSQLTASSSCGTVHRSFSSSSILPPPPPQLHLLPPLQTLSISFSRFLICPQCCLGVLAFRESRNRTKRRGCEWSVWPYPSLSISGQRGSSFAQPQCQLARLLPRTRACPLCQGPASVTARPFGALPRCP